MQSNRPIRILFASNFYPPYVIGGAEVVAAHLATWLAQAGQDVTVVSTCGRDEDPMDGEVDGVRVLRYYPPNLWWNFDRFRPGDTRTRVSRLIWNVRDAWNRSSANAFAKILESVKPEIVHTHNIKGMSPAIWREARRRKIPTLHTTHDYHMICQSGSMTRDHVKDCTTRCLGCKVQSRWYLREANHLDRVCSPSRFVARRYEDAGLRTARGLAVVANGIPGESRARMPPPADQPVRLLFLGQLRPEKGAHLLPQIAAHLAPSARIDVAGTGPLAPELAEAAKKDGRLVLHGFVAQREKQKLLESADALLFPSIWSENAPIVLCEAFMQGVPVIAGDLGAIPEFVESGINGILCEPGSAVSFAAAAQKLRTEPGLYAKLSSGATKAADRYTVASMGKNYLSLYRELLA